MPSPHIRDKHRQMHRGLTTLCRQPAALHPDYRGSRSATRAAALAHLLHARLLLSEVLVEDDLLVGRQHGADLGIPLVVDRLHLRERLGAVAATLHRLADRLQLGLILRVDLGDLALLGLGQLDAVQRAVEATTAATRATLLLRGGRGLGTGDRGSAGEEGDAERRDADCLHGTIPRVMDGRTKRLTSWLDVTYTSPSSEPG